MKKKKILSNAYLSTFCLELGYILRSGMPLGNGLSLLRDDDDSAKSRALLDQLCTQVDQGRPLSGALLSSGRFPEYMVRMVSLAERTGKMEATLMALSCYYEQQRLLALNIRQALLHPALLGLVFVVVVTVLVTQVLPVFDSVLRQMGSALSPMAQGLMNFGRGLADASALIAVILGLAAMTGILLAAIPALRQGARSRLYYRFGGFGVWGDILRARFARAFSIAIASGLNAGESIDSAGALVSGARGMDERVEKCRRLLATGDSLPAALSASGIFSARNSRMIAMGFETGSIDQVMEEISRRSENGAQERISGIVSAIEPAIVILTSLVAGLILLSVMLPLVNIMSGIR